MHSILLIIAAYIQHLLLTARQALVKYVIGISSLKPPTPPWWRHCSFSYSREKNKMLRCWIICTIIIKILQQNNCFPKRDRLYFTSMLVCYIFQLHVNCLEWTYLASCMLCTKSSSWTSKFLYHKCTSRKCSNIYMGILPNII